MQRDDPSQPYWQRDISPQARLYKSKRPDTHMSSLLSYDAAVRDSQHSVQELQSNIRVNGLATPSVRKVRLYCKQARLNEQEVLALADNEIQMAYGIFIRNRSAPDKGMQFCYDTSEQFINAFSTPLYPLEDASHFTTMLKAIKGSGLLAHAITRVLLKYQDQMGCEAALNIAMDVDTSRIHRPTFISHRHMRELFDLRMRPFDHFVKVLESEEDISPGDLRVLKDNKVRIWELTLRAMTQQAGPDKLR